MVSDSYKVPVNLPGREQVIPGKPGTLIPLGDDADDSDPLRVVPNREGLRKFRRGWGLERRSRSRLRRGRWAGGSVRGDVVAFLAGC